MPLYLQFYFWLLLVSGLVFALERLFPWRRDQEVMRPGFVQDLFWMVFNTQYLSWMLAIVSVQAALWFNATVLHFGLPAPESLRLIATWPVWVQFFVFFLVKDFLEWNIHRTLHRVPWMWRFHRLHHSIEDLDWAATFRAHWGEVVIYKVLIYLPLVVLGVSDGVVFAILACSLFVQELSHANLRWDFGPLRYVVNSPRFHAWHHDVEQHGATGQNFGVTLAIWDWIFGTAHWPKATESPRRFGLDESPPYPRDIWGRLWEPFLRRRPVPPSAAPARVDKKEAA